MSIKFLHGCVINLIDTLLFFYFLDVWWIVRRFNDDIIPTLKQ